MCGNGVGQPDHAAFQGGRQAAISAGGRGRGRPFSQSSPLRRKLSLRLYRCPYWETMKPWERKMYEWGLLGYLVQDVIEAITTEPSRSL